MTTANKIFAQRFKEAYDGFDRALRISNEAQATYYLGVLSGMLATILPESESRALTQVTGMGIGSIHREVQPVLSRANELVKKALNLD